jgi:hypothetical protein
VHCACSHFAVRVPPPRLQRLSTLPRQNSDCHNYLNECVLQTSLTMFKVSGLVAGAALLALAPQGSLAESSAILLEQGNAEAVMSTHIWVRLATVERHEHADSALENV